MFIKVRDMDYIPQLLNVAAIAGVRPTGAENEVELLIGGKWTCWFIDFEQVYAMLNRAHMVLE